MESQDIPEAVEAARAVAASLGLVADEAVTLQATNRITVRLLPANVVARVADVAHLASAEFELAVAQRLADSGGPVAEPDPRVPPHAYVREGFVVNLWTYYEPVLGPPVSPADFAESLAALHAGMRGVDVAAPHFMERVAEARRLVENAGLSPELSDTDRELLSRTLRALPEAIQSRGQPEQLLHGEPHPGNLLRTEHGFRFIDFETCCRGPVEFDVASAPEAVGDHYPGLNSEVLRECRILTLALVAAWRWDREDRFPDGRQMGMDLLDQIRAALGS